MTPTDPRDNYLAPWGYVVKLITSLFVLLLGGIAFMGARSAPELGAAGQAVMLGAPLVTLVGSAFFTIRGYQLADGVLLIKRVNWQTTIASSP